MRQPAVHTTLLRAAARRGRAVSCRVIVSSVEAAVLGLKVVPLNDAWAERSFAVCFRDFDALQPPAPRLAERAAQAADKT